MPRSSRRLLLALVFLLGFACATTIHAAEKPHAHGDHHHAHVEFTIQSARNGRWSDADTWKPARVPKAGDRVKIAREHTVLYDVESDAVLRLVQIVGVLRFARDRDTLMNVAVLKVQNSEDCSESGFACDFAGVNQAGEPQSPLDGSLAGRLPTLEVGTLEEPIPAEHTARIRLHFIDGMEKNDAPALVCCSARMELHGAPLSRTWVELGADVAEGDKTVTLAEAVTGWRVGDEVIVTGSERRYGRRRENPAAVTTENRRVTKIDGMTLHLDKPLDYVHFGSGEFRSEVANLSRNVIVESADPDGVRGHTLYHAFSQGGISYARFAHLGKEGVLGRYAIHFHLASDTMRGSQVLGAAIVDSHNRWITIHGTEYLVVRDCVGYQSVGHGYFMEDGTEVYNLLDRNLGVLAYRAKRLPEQVLPFDPNDGAAFWWANGRNTLVRNVACENDEYGFRYDMQDSRYFSSTLPIKMPDGSRREVDVRTIGIWRFEDNESHTEGLYGLVVAANGNRQPDTSIRSREQLERIKDIDWTGPDARHPHMIRNLTLWDTHYAFRAQSPSMRMENVRIHDAAYGIYRPALENHEYVNLHISQVGAEPFNRGMDDASAQLGTISVDGLTFETGYGNSSTPLVQISDNKFSDDAATHFRNVTVLRPEQFKDRWPLANRGVGPRVPPVTGGVPIYLHDHFGPGRHAKIVSAAAKDLLSDGEKYVSMPPLTGSEAKAAEVDDVAWPKLLDPVDDVPPATIITSLRRDGGKLHIVGVAHDNGEITKILVNGQPADVVSRAAGVVDWKIVLPSAGAGEIEAHAVDDAGNVEQTVHRVQIGSTLARK
ncbi:MAG: G8 domain-containing protein [Pirellulaceae bacterium]